MQNPNTMYFTWEENTIVKKLSIGKSRRNNQTNWSKMRKKKGPPPNTSWNQKCLKDRTGRVTTKFVRLRWLHSTWHFCRPNSPASGRPARNNAFAFQIHPPEVAKHTLGLCSINLPSWGGTARCGAFASKLSRYLWAVGAYQLWGCSSCSTCFFFLSLLPLGLLR